MQDEAHVVLAARREADLLVANESVEREWGLVGSANELSKRRRNVASGLATGHYPITFQSLNVKAGTGWVGALAAVLNNACHMVT